MHLTEYHQVTDSVSVTVRPIFLDNESLPENAHYVWVYHIKIQNRGTKTVQLVSRYWHITDANGHVQKVEGEGVVGEQPVLAPDVEFEYASGVHLATPSGMMMGFYTMEITEGVEKGHQFQIAIPVFSLDSPEQVSRPN